MTKARQRLQEALGYRFEHADLLQTALTHRSYGTPNYERLEFLGDGLLNATVADLLYRQFPDLHEGDLSRLRANLVRQESLHRIAQHLSLGAELLLGDGEKKSGGAGRPSILADALEAILGAVYLDGGFAHAHALVERLFKAEIERINPRRDAKDPKTRLQEYLQGRRLPLPTYTVINTHGEAHAQQFEVRCEIAGLPQTSVGRGSSRRLAEQQAAESILTLIETFE